MVSPATGVGASCADGDGQHCWGVGRVLLLAAPQGFTPQEQLGHVSFLSVRPRAQEVDAVPQSPKAMLTVAFN